MKYYSLQKRVTKLTTKCIPGFIQGANIIKQYYKKLLW